MSFFNSLITLNYLLSRLRAALEFNLGWAYFEQLRYKGLWRKSCNQLLPFRPVITLVFAVACARALGSAAALFGIHFLWWARILGAYWIDFDTRRILHFQRTTNLAKELREPVNNQVF